MTSEAGTTLHVRVMIMYALVQSKTILNVSISPHTPLYN